jgi:hypothetical protein
MRSGGNPYSMIPAEGGGGHLGKPITRDVSSTVLSGLLQISKAIHKEEKEGEEQQQQQQQQQQEALLRITVPTQQPLGGGSGGGVGGEGGGGFVAFNLANTLEIHKQMIARQDHQYWDYSKSQPPFDDARSDDGDSSGTATPTRTAAGLLAIAACLGLQREDYEDTSNDIAPELVGKALASGGGPELLAFLRSTLGVTSKDTAAAVPTGGSGSGSGSGKAEPSAPVPPIKLLPASFTAWADTTATITRPSRALHEEEKKALFSFLG